MHIISWDGFFFVVVFALAEKKEREDIDKKKLYGVRRKTESTICAFPNNVSRV